VSDETLTDSEHTALIYASSRDNVLSCSFGPSGVWLTDIDSNRWAFNLLKQIRDGSDTNKENKR
jgi:hypothetical protein